jgi:hypothetical protein
MRCLSSDPGVVAVAAFKVVVVKLLLLLGCGSGKGWPILQLCHFQTRPHVVCSARVRCYCDGDVVWSIGVLVLPSLEIP